MQQKMLRKLHATLVDWRTVVGPAMPVFVRQPLRKGNPCQAGRLGSRGCVRKHRDSSKNAAVAGKREALEAVDVFESEEVFETFEQRPTAGPRRQRTPVRDRIVRQRSGIKLQKDHRKSFMRVDWICRWATLFPFRSI
jgi:hypothetical protein